MSLIIPNTFATQTGAIQLSDLDENFNYVKTQVDPLKDNITIGTGGDISLTGNLALTGIGKRITGDFSNATIANRAAFQTSTVNGNTGIFVLPNGTSTITNIQLANTPNPTNSSVAILGIVDSTDVRLQSATQGTGTFLPMTMYTGGSERMRIDSLGNVGIGTSSPSSKYHARTDGDSFNLIGQIQNRNGGANTGGAIAFINSGNDLGDNRYAYIGAITSGAGQNGNNLVFGTNLNGGVPAERMRITANGQLQTMVTGGPSISDAFVCRAWVNFNGTASGAFTGGTSTVSRTAGSTTARVTTTTNHGLLTGNTVSVLTGVVAGAYVVTVTSNTTFTITTVATTVLTNAAITFAVNLIRASGNVSSITDNGVGDYTVNFTTAMQDTNYSAASFGSNNSDNLNEAMVISRNATSVYTVSACGIYTTRISASAVGRQDGNTVCVSIFR